MLVTKLNHLTTEQLKNLHGVIIEASLAHDLKGDYKAIFKQHRAISKGGLKKIYSGLAKAKKEHINSMIEALVTLLPKGVN